MIQSRRTFFATASATVLTPVAALAEAPPDISPDIISLFDHLPGRKSMLIWAPATENAAEFSVRMKPNTRLFVGSAFKALVLCERLRQLDSVDVVTKLVTNLLPLDASIWSLSSSMFDPPNLSGKTPERTAAEAMIMHSDNTGTDMMMLAAGPAHVRRFIAEIGLTRTNVPDSTRSFLGYILGIQDFRRTTWQQLLAAADKTDPFVNPPLNNLETMASTAVDLVSFYADALHGHFFNHPQTLGEFRRILSTADAISRAVPLGASAYAKGGSIDVPGFHALCIAGGMVFSGRWVYFTIIINWDAAPLEDPATVGAWASAVSKALQIVYDGLS
jgi:beta-lactamase class A